MGYDPYLGEIILFAGGYEPQGWKYCWGQLLPINQNQALYSILGTTYGGDGKTTFALPDLRGRVPVGIGQLNGTSTYSIGQKGGTEAVQLTQNNIPSHNHGAKINEANVSTEITLKAYSKDGNKTSPEGAIPAVINRQEGPGQNIRQSGYTQNEADVNMKPTPVNIMLNNINVEVSNTGGSQPVENRQPYLGMNYIIAIEGIYPIRS